MARCAGVRVEERLFDELAVGEGVGVVLGRRLRARAERRRRHAVHASGVPSRLARLLVAGADEELREPGIEPLRLTEPRELTPCLDHGLLDGVLGRVRVPKDLAGDPEQPLAGRANEPLEGVLVAARSPTDHIGRSRASLRRSEPAVARDDPGQQGRSGSGDHRQMMRRPAGRHRDHPLRSVAVQAPKAAHIASIAPSKSSIIACGPAVAMTSLSSQL